MRVLAVLAETEEYPILAWPDPMASQVHLVAVLLFPMLAPVMVISSELALEAQAEIWESSLPLSQSTMVESSWYCCSALSCSYRGSSENLAALSVLRDSVSSVVAA